MDGITAFCLWTFLTCSAAFAAGHIMTASKLTASCADTGEMVVKDTVFKCAITHKIINGRRTALAL